MLHFMLLNLSHLRTLKVQLRWLCFFTVFMLSEHGVDCKQRVDNVSGWISFNSDIECLLSLDVFKSVKLHVIYRKINWKKLLSELKNQTNKMSAGPNKQLQLFPFLLSVFLKWSHQTRCSVVKPIQPLVFKSCDQTCPSEVKQIYAVFCKVQTLQWRDQEKRWERQNREEKKNHRERTRKAKNSLASCKSPKREQTWWCWVIQRACSCCWRLLTVRHSED